MAAHRRFRRDHTAAAETKTAASFEWKRGECLAMASQTCTFCFGLGTRAGRAGHTSVCNCVLRAIFRACFRRFQQTDAKEKYISRVSLEANPGRTKKSTWGMKNEEYMADFILVAKRTLAGDKLAWDVFRYHFLLGADWKLCCRKLNMDRGEFFHEVYRVEQKLGRAFRETQPYGLFPVDEYFGFRTTNGGTTKVSTGKDESVLLSETKILTEKLDALFPVESPREAAEHSVSSSTSFGRLRFPVAAA